MQPIEALQTLKEGNQRYLSGACEAGQSGPHEFLSSQQPFAIILGCSDSRVPAEMIFDQGFGRLFVIRVAGNVVAPAQTGSVEFAVQQFKSPLVVVLGHSNCGAVAATHSNCGAVAATIAQLESPDTAFTPNVQSIVDRISPAVSTLLETQPGTDKQTLTEHAIRANIRHAADQLRHGSPVLEERIASNELLVVGAEYSLETGTVDFFDAVPD